MFIVLCLILLLLLGLLIKESAMFHAFIKTIVVLYYIVITPIFIIGYKRIRDKYNMSDGLNDGPVIPEGWGIKSDWAFFFSFAFIIPIWFLVIFVLFRKMKPTRAKKIAGLILSHEFYHINFKNIVSVREGDGNKKQT
ncbi:hypothetical protein [Gracilibacillus timonensis]|uniref:hypothetical protein n=1 Tax=Gracilibacillus timonensis TaxID=1816696 RepID=UPI0008261D69|nr:hypothetical protein [Gracilibacillus timonensis]